MHDHLPIFRYDGPMQQSQRQGTAPGLFHGYPALPGTYDEMFDGGGSHSAQAVEAGGVAWPVRNGLVKPPRD